MKKTMLLILCAALALSLAACGEPAAAETTPTPAATEAPATEESAATEAPEASEAPEESLLDIAKQYEGRPLEELIAAVGEPESRDYAPSCLGDGEDGNLYYDGFTVYTYKDDSGELVNYVE